MKIIVTGKNINVSDKIQTAIEKKFEKLGKYFADDIKANVVIHPEKAKVKMEATIATKGAIFRAEDVSQDIFDCIDIVADKLSSQMSKYKGKMLRKNKSNESVRFEMIPETAEPEEGKVVKIIDGPLMGFEGTIIKYNLHKRVAMVEIDFAGNKSKIQLGIDIIEEKK